MRTLNSLKNIFWKLLTQITILLLGFVSRKVLIDSLGIEYVGLNGLLSNIFSVLSLVEGGLGTTIVFNLYKPLAEKNDEQVQSLIYFYKKVYICLAGVITILSFILYPLVFVTVSASANITNLSLVYLLYVSKLVISYLYSHKWSLINADQKGYVIQKNTLLFQVITMIMKIVVLNKTKNYVLFMALELFVQIIQNIINNKIVNKYYQHILYNNNKKPKPLSSDIKRNIVTNVKALFFHNLGSVMVNGTDNILITKFISLSMTGIYSNYTLIISSLANLISPFISNLGASIGNLIAIEKKEKIYEVFKTTFFINFLLFSITSVILFNTITPFIIFYFGNGLEISNFTLCLLLINYYTSGMTSSIFQFKTKAGIFTNDRYAPIIEAFLNLSVSIVLGMKIGINGIIIGTIISRMAVIFISQPYLTYKYVFGENIINYYTTYFKYGIITVLSILISSKVCNFITGYSFIIICIKGIISCLISLILIVIFFVRSKEMNDLIQYFKKILVYMRKI